jgi:glycosyltransferase involved in cell wall biosynthesis
VTNCRVAEVMARSDHRPRVVVVTPVPVRRDSRVLKQSLSLARAGFRSILFEGERSLPPVMLPDVEIVALGGKGSTGKQAGAGSLSFRTKLKKRITGPDASWFEAWVGFVAYLFLYMQHYFFGGLRHLPPASIYYLSEFSFFPAVWVKSKWYGAAIAYDARDFYVGIEADSNKTRFQKLVVGFGGLIERRCIEEAQVFTTVGEGIATLLERQYSRRPEVIYNAHDERIDKNCERGLRQRIGLEKDTPLAVIVGHAKPGQDISGTLGALWRLPMLHVALIGTGYREMMTSRALRAEVSARVHCIEDVAASEIVPLIRDADVALLIYYPRSDNYKNALPNGFFQSVAAGLPLLYGALPEISRICREYDFGVAVAPNDVDSLTELLTRAVHKSEWYEEQRRRSARAASSLTWQRAEAKLQRLLIDCLPQ